MIISNVAISTIADTSSNSYASSASANLATGTLPGYVYVYGATANAAAATITITVTFGSTAYNGVICTDSVGYGLTAAYTSSASGQLSSATTSHTACAFTGYKCFNGVSVPSMTTTPGDLVMSLMLGYSCGVPFAWPAVGPNPKVSGLYNPIAPGAAFYLPFGSGNAVATATSCGASNFSMFGDSSISGPSVPGLCNCGLIPNTNLAWGSGASTIANYTGIVGPNLISGGNTADWVELAIDFPANTAVTIGTSTGTGTLTTTLTTIGPSGTTTMAVTSTYTYTVTSTAVAETNTMSVHRGLANPLLNDSNLLQSLTHFASPLLSESNLMQFFGSYPVPKALNEPVCLGVATNVDNMTYTNTGPQCAPPAPVQGQTLVVACNFFQLQCWAYPLMFMGMYDGFFIAAALSFRFSEKGFLYFTLAGATLCSIIEISLGIMTPMVPIMLIVINIAYSFRLERLVSSKGSPQQ